MLSEDIHQNNEELISNPADVLRQLDKWKKEMMKDPVYAQTFDLYNAMIVTRDSYRDTLTGYYETYYIKVYKASRSTSILVEKVNTNLATDTKLNCYGYEIANIDKSFTSFRLSYKNGMLDDFRGDTDKWNYHKISTGNGWGHPDNYDQHVDLVYSSVPIPDYPQFVGQASLNSNVSNVVDIVKGAFASMEKKKFKGYVNCDKETAYFVYWNHKPTDKYFDERYGNYIKEAKEYTYLGHRDTPEYGTNSYIGNGGRAWQYVKQMDNGVHLRYLKGPKTPMSGNEYVYTNNQAVAYLLVKQCNYPEDRVKYVDHPDGIPEAHGGGYDCSGKPWPPEGDTPIVGLAYFPLKTNRFLKYKDPYNADILKCYTFNQVSDLGEGNFTLKGTNGRMIDYVNDNGCWHQNYAKPDSYNINMKGYSEISTNSESLKNIFTKAGIKHTYYKNKRPDNFPYDEYVNQLWGKSKRLYFASWTEGQGGEEGDIILIAFDRAENDGTVLDSEAWRLKKEVQGQWKDKWIPEWPEKTDAYGFTSGKKRYVRFSTNHRNLYGYLTRHNMLDDKAKYISPCTTPGPDGQLPPGVQGPNLPPDVQKPGSGNEPLGPEKPSQPGGGDGPIGHNDIGCSLENDYLYTKANNKLNGLYYYYLEDSLFGSNNTEVLGSTEAIVNVAYTPFLKMTSNMLCKVPFDQERYSPYEPSSSAPWVYRIKGDFKATALNIANWYAYPTPKKATSPGTPWQWHHESRLFDYPYRKIAFVSNVFEIYDIIPHLYYEATKSNTINLKACCAVTPGGNFYTYVDGYKNDGHGFTERQYSTASMDIPNTSSAYSNYLSTQKAQASTGIKTAGMTAAGATLGAIAGFIMPGAGNAVGAAVGAGIGAAISGGISVASSVMDNMAYRQDLLTTPKTLTSMGGDVMARIGCANNTTVMACDMEITPQYKDRLARFFHMFGTKQNKVLDVESNINSRYYFNYIKTSGCNISANGVPKKHIAKIKAVMDRGTTFWHVDNSGVKLGEYCVYDNVEV